MPGVSPRSETWRLPRCCTTGSGAAPPHHDGAHAPSADSGTDVTHNRKIAVIGLGYVGLPVAVCFARSGTRVIGYDIDRERVVELSKGHDRTREVEPSDLRHPSLVFTTDDSLLRG